MTFEEWMSKESGFYYCAPGIREHLKDCWHAAQEAMRERCAKVAEKYVLSDTDVDSGVRFSLDVGKYVGDDIRALEVE